MGYLIIEEITTIKWISRDVKWVQLVYFWDPMSTLMNLGFRKLAEFLDPINYQLLE
jgi:hypothetical protein